ncbi:MAG: hypothetical protein RLZZ602_1598 [Pseudomonadota bacterium]
MAAGVNQEAAGAAVVVLGGETTLVLHPVHHILLLLELVGLLVQRVEQRVELADKATFYQLPQPVDLVAQVAQLPLAAQAAVVLELAVVTVAQGGLTQGMAQVAVELVGIVAMEGPVGAVLLYPVVLALAVQVVAAVQGVLLT